MTECDRTIRLYYLFSITRFPVFWGTIIITYIMEVGHMTLSEVYNFEMWCVIIVAALQVPTGAYADLVGRVRALKIGLVFLILQGIAFVLADGPFLIWVSNILWAIGFSFASGADSAFLYDTLLDYGREKEFRKIQGRALAYALALTAVLAPLAGHLAAWNIRAPLMADVMILCIGLFFACKLSEPAHHTQGTKRSAGRQICLGAREVATHPRIIWLIAFMVTIAVTGKLWFFTYNPYFKHVGMPIHQFGHLFCLMNVVAAISGYMAEAQATRLSNRLSITFILLAIGIPIWAMGVWVSKGAALLVLFQQWVRGYLKPFVDGLFQKEVASDKRATVASVQSMAAGLLEVLCLAWFSKVTEEHTLPVALQGLGITALAVGLVLIATYGKVFKEASDVSSEVQKNGSAEAPLEEVPPRTANM